MVQTVAIASGKGGVGKTSIVVNCAVNVALTQKGVLILDADFGLANAHIMLNQKTHGSITDFIEGKKSIDELIHILPYGLRLIPGGSGDLEVMNLDSKKRWEVIKSLNHLASDLDYLFVDTPAGASDSSIEFASACDKIVIVLVGEPTSFMDAYAFIKALALEKGVEYVSIIVNMAKDASDAKASFISFQKIVSQFLSVELEFLGWLPESRIISNSIISRKPFALNEKSSTSVVSNVIEIVSAIDESPVGQNSTVRFFDN